MIKVNQHTSKQVYMVLDSISHWSGHSDKTLKQSQIHIQSHSEPDMIQTLHFYKHFNFPITKYL